MGRSPCCDKVGLKRGPWTSEEDQKLLAYIEEHGHGNWRSLPAKAGLQRCGKSCRLRWTNYLRPDIKRGKFTLQEEQTIIQLHALLGNRWSAIAAHLSKRTDNEIKNYWNTHLKKRLTKMGIDPVTHKPKSVGLGVGQSRDAANLSHMAQWESARLEAEARLVRGSKLVSNPYQTHQQSSSASARLLNKVPPCLDVLKAWQSAWTINNNNNQPNKDGHHGGDVLSSLFNSNLTLESPTSTLSFSENNLINIAPPIGFVDNLSSIGAAARNYAESCRESAEIGITKEDHVPNDWNCLESQNVDEHHATYNNIEDTLELPSFMEGFTDLIPENAEGYTLSNAAAPLDENVDGNIGIIYAPM